MGVWLGEGVCVCVCVCKPFITPPAALFVILHSDHAGTWQIYGPLDKFRFQAFASWPCVCDIRFQCIRQWRKLGGGQGEFVPHVLVHGSFDSLNILVTRTRGGRVALPRACWWRHWSLVSWRTWSAGRGDPRMRGPGFPVRCSLSQSVFKGLS